MLVERFRELGLCGLLVVLNMMRLLSLRFKPVEERDGFGLSGSAGCGGICTCPSPFNVLAGDPGDGGEFDCDAAGELREERVKEPLRV